MSKTLRLLLLPLGLVKKIVELANEGARDIQNKYRFQSCIIDRGVSIDPNSKLNVHVHILPFSIINNSKIEVYTYVGSRCIIQNTSIGRYCSIANDVLIGLGQHPIDYFTTSPMFYRTINPLKVSIVKKELEFEEHKKIIIGNDVWIGARAIIQDGVQIGNGAIIASNAVVTRDVPPYAIVGGSPAKLIRYRIDQQRRTELETLNWWEWEVEKIIAFFELE
jgi:acetyltransferase-like isoleucine patch superfamily enzyme